ncbi:MAG: hypothetical protein M3021_04830, partial [Actinomycetota bacterium]|nr:hypothetical protein [Actinomycetota bacterium]
MTKRGLGAVLAGVGLSLVLLLGMPVSGQPPGVLQGCRFFPETGKQVCGKFLTYWAAHGGLAQQGLPLSAEFPEVSELDGKTYTVQYFERAVFELHPENAPPYDVLLSQLGTYQFGRRHPGGELGDAFAGLRQRPLQLPRIAPGSGCPTTPGRQVNPAFGPALGSGPVYPAGFGTVGVANYAGALVEGGWSYYKVLWIADPTYHGPILIRGRQIDGPNEVRFERGADPPAELRLTAEAAAGDGWTNWPSYTRLHAAGCYAYQVDGQSFTRIIFF